MYKKSRFKKVKGKKQKKKKEEKREWGGRGRENCPERRFPGNSFLKGVLSIIRWDEVCLTVRLSHDKLFGLRQTPHLAPE